MTPYQKRRHLSLTSLLIGRLTWSDRLAQGRPWLNQTLNQLSGYCLFTLPVITSWGAASRTVFSMICVSPWVAPFRATTLRFSARFWNGSWGMRRVSIPPLTTWTTSCLSVNETPTLVPVCWKPSQL
uniref:Uncharacterized protein n=1 Tax=Engystomops pustulosus TaxID=76066 RepID=A0AAV6YNI5_ENGPU|nr:hypothetical protein GDO81_023137 [Engystomops pustulosus]